MLKLSATLVVKTLTMRTPNFAFSPMSETTLLMTLLCRKMSSTLNTYVPVLDGTNYQEWAARMQSYLMSQGQW